MASKSILKKSIGFRANTLYQSELQIIDAAVSTYASLASTLVPNGAPQTIEAATFVDKEAFTAMKKAYRAMISHPDNRKYVFPCDQTKLLKEGDENDPIFWAYELITQWLFVCAKKVEKKPLAPESRKHEREEEEEKAVVITFNRMERARLFEKEEWKLGEETFFATRCYCNKSPCSQALISILMIPGSSALNTQGKEAVNRFLGTKPTKAQTQSVIDELCAVRRRIVSTGKYIIRPNMLTMDRRNLAMLFETDILMRRAMAQMD